MPFVAVVVVASFAEAVATVSSEAPVVQRDCLVVELVVDAKWVVAAVAVAAIELAAVVVEAELAVAVEHT